MLTLIATTAGYLIGKAIHATVIQPIIKPMINAIIDKVLSKWYNIGVNQSMCISS